MRTYKAIKNIFLRRKIAFEYSKYLTENVRLKNSKNGKRCFIIGNGPSIKNMDLLKLTNEETFVVNTFWKHPDYVTIRPKYHVIIGKHEIFPSNMPDGNYFTKELINNLGLMSSTKTTLFLNVAGKSKIDKLDCDKPQIYYLATFGHFKKNLNFNIDLSKIIPYPKNVIVACIIIAAYMGFEKIYLLGCEHGFLANPNHYEGFKHFFESKHYDQNNPDEVKEYALDIMSYEQHIDNIKILFQNYRLLKEKLKLTHPNLKIFNATPNSFLDVFPFVKYDDIL